ncbi:MAG: hypothetical protein NZ853_06645 [Leptospiraceae bacterium]|nr:hypothetical protein [Leptospiraceae bacterium]MDW7975889.1 hypothetical protein [Leptospiraceae bacterium]
MKFERNKSSIEKQMQLLYEEYLKTNNLAPLFEMIYQVFPKILLRYYRNYDFVYDTIVDFIENDLKKTIAYYQNLNDDVSFYRYLYKAIRNHIYTLDRKAKRQSIEYIQFSSKEEKIIPFRRNIEENKNEISDFWFYLSQALKQLNLEDVLVFKLSHDIPLNTDELVYLIQRLGYEKTKRFLRNYRAKKERFIEKNFKNEIRLNRKYYKKFYDKENPFLQSHFNFTQKTIFRIDYRPKFKDISQLLNVSQSKIHYTINKVKKHLKEYLRLYKNNNGFSSLAA